MNKNKVIILTSIIVGVLVATLGLTYSVMTFNQTGRNSELVLGDIYMHYNEISGLSISDIVPGAPYSNYFEFQISGKNTYTKKDIYYDFLLTRGDLPSGKTEANRIPDKYLKFKLVSVDASNNETVLLTDETYESLENQRIYVETIAKNTTIEVNRTYRLYVTIDYSLVIGNTEQAVFSIEEWENAFASIKVNVTGDFLEKKILSYNDCFKTRTLSNGTIEITDYYKYSPSSTNELYQNKLCTSDVVIPSQINGVNVSSIGYSSFSYNNLTSIQIPNTVSKIDSFAFEDNDLTSIIIPDSVTSLGYSVFNHNKLTDNYFIYERTDENGDGIAEVDNTRINSYAGEATDVTIPNGVSILETASFMGCSIENIVIPESVTIIRMDALSGNELTSVVIPDSVVEIEAGAFKGNYGLETVEIGSGITFIDNNAFGSGRDNNGYPITDLTILKINKTCDVIKNQLGISKYGQYNYYPWLHFNEPYIAYNYEPVKIYGSNNELCDTFQL